jgi:hypothetical protein
MILTKVIILTNNASFSKMNELSKLLNSSDIKNNGKLIANCSIDCNIIDIRKQIYNIFEVPFNCIFVIIRKKFTKFA